MHLQLIEKIMIPKNYRLQFKREQIQQIVHQLAEQLEPWVDEQSKATGQDVIAIPILHGGIFFYADLSREIQHSLTLFPLKASAYTGNETQASELKIDFDFSTVKGRAVLLADEICESGRSLSEVTKACYNAGAVAVAQAVLIRREGAGTFEPKFVGWNYNGPEWFVGYGMDDNGRHRNLGDIYVIEK